MTDREVMQQALEALEGLFGLPNQWESGGVAVWRLGGSDASRQAITALRTALEQKQAEPVTHAVVAGALFDFMGWLTTRTERLILSSTDNASPAVESITEFAKMRGLSLDDARVQDWQNYTTPLQRPWVGLTDEEILRADPRFGKSESDVNPYQILGSARDLEAKLKERNT